MVKKSPKLVIINNDPAVENDITIIYQNDMFTSHLEYYQDLLNKKTFNNISLESLNSSNKNLLAAHICLENNLVFVDNSKTYSNEKVGIIYLPANTSQKKKDLLMSFITSYSVLIIITNLKYDSKKQLTGDEHWLFEEKPIPKKFKIKIKTN